MSSTSTSHQRRVSGRATKGVGKPHFEPNTGGGLATKLSTPEASATTRSTRAGTPPPRTPHHYPDSPQSSANVTALPAVVARPDPPPDDHSSRTSFRHALITHCLLPAGCYGQDPRAAATTTPSARRSLTLTATTSAAARRRLQHRPREAATTTDRASTPSATRSLTSLSSREACFPCVDAALPQPRYGTITLFVNLLTHSPVDHLPSQPPAASCFTIYPSSQVPTAVVKGATPSPTSADGILH